MATFEKVGFDPFASANAGSSPASPPAGGPGVLAKRPTLTKVEGNPFDSGRVAKRPGRSWGEAATDSLLGVASGTANIVGGLLEGKASAEPTNLARQGLRLLDRVGVKGAGDLAARVPGTAVETALGHAPGTGAAAVSAGMKAAGDWIGGKQSEALQEDKRELSQTEGFFGSAKKVLTSPRLLGNFVAEQVPNLATLGGGTRLAAARAGQRALVGAVAKGLGPEAAEAAAATAGKQAATRAATGITTAMETGSAGQQTYQQAMAQPQSVWDANPEYQRLLAAGAAPLTAKETIARGASMQAQAITAPIAAVAGRFAAPFEADVFTRGLARKPVSLLQGAAKETVEETIQEGGSQLAGNIGQRQVDPNQGLWDGVPEAAGTGAALGAVLGGGMAAGGAIASKPVAAATDEERVARRPQPPAIPPPELPPAPRALPPSDGTPSFGVNIVSPGGTVLTPEQRGLDPRVVGEPAAPVPNPAAVPGLRVASDSLNQQAQSTRPSPATVPFPDAAPGSLSEVANLTAAAPSGNLSGESNSVLNASPSGNGQQDAIDGGAAAATTPAAAAAPVLPPPWVDADTGESLRAPTRQDIEQLLHANLNYQMESGGGINTKATLKTMRDQYGLGSAVVRPALEKVKAERKRGITSTEAPAGADPGSDVANLSAAGPDYEAVLRDQVLAAAERKAAREAAGRQEARPEGETTKAEGGEVDAPVPTEAASYDTSEEMLDTDTGAPSGGPFTIEEAAQRTAGRTDGGRVFPVDGGFVVRTPRTGALEPGVDSPSAARQGSGPAGAVNREGMGGGTAVITAELGRVSVGKPDGWNNQNAQASRDSSDRHGLTGEIERLFADGQTAREVQASLGDRLAFMPLEDRGSFVVQVRATLGIPSRSTAEGKAEFDQWKLAREERLAARQSGDGLAGGVASAEQPSAGSGVAGDTSTAVADSMPESPGPDLAGAAAEAATSPTNDLPEPTDAQKEAGNYRKGHTRINGHDISIENPAGSRRRPEWPALKHHYGYIKGTVGKDKDHVDVFMTDRAEDPQLPVFVVDQVNKDGSFDEHKVVMGTGSEAEARKTYLANYEKGWTGLGGIKQMSQEEFKAWVRDPKKTIRRATRGRSKPAAAALAADQATSPQSTRSPTAPAPAAPAPTPAPEATGNEGPGAAAQDYKPKVRKIGGSPEYDRSDIGTLGAFFQPGRVVPGYAGMRDRVLEFRPKADALGRWSVKVQRVDKDGNYMPDEDARWHSTIPTPAALAEVLGKPQLKARKAAQRGGRKTPDKAPAVPDKPTNAPDKAGPEPDNSKSAPGKRAAITAPDSSREPSPQKLFSLAPDPVASPAFKRWFAGSQVVGANGRPQTVFHGTSEEFYTFSKHRSGEATGHATAPLGHFFTTDRNLAKRYAENASDGVPADERVIDAHLRIENPYVMPLEEAQSLDSPEASAAFQAYLQRQGFDGIQIPEAKTWIAFRPEQIKSASENRGTFELTNPDIRFSRGDGGPGLTFDRALQLKSELTSKWGKNAPNVVVVRSAEDFPASAKVDPAYRRAEGLYNGTPTVWINAAAITNEARFGQVLAHEAIGHYGVESVVGQGNWRQIVDAIDRLASTGGGSPGLRSVLESVSQRYGTVDRETFAREAIAVMAERGIRNSFTSRIIAAVRRFLRTVMPSLQWSEGDVRDLLSQADGFLRSGPAQGARQATVQAYAFSQGQRGDSAKAPAAEEAEAYRAQFDKTVDSLRTVVPPITVGRTPAVLRALGAPDLPITIRRDTVRKASNGIKHNVPREVMRRLPELLANPVAVFDSKTEPGSLAVVLEAQDGAGRPVLAALHMKVREGRALEVNRVASAYGKDYGESTFAKWAREGLLRYVSETKNPELVRLSRLYMPGSGSPDQGSSVRKVLREQDVVQQERDRVNVKSPYPVRLVGLQSPVSGSPNQDPSGRTIDADGDSVQQGGGDAGGGGRRLFSMPESDALDDIDALQRGLQGEGILARAKQLLADLTPKKLKDAQRPTWLGALGTRHLTELGADYFGNINHYSNYLAEMQADRNQLQAEAETTAESARKWVGKNKEEADQLFKLMHDSTIDGVDPSKAYQPLMFKMPGQKGQFEASAKNIKRAIEVKKQQMRERSGDSKANMINEIKALEAMGYAEPRRRRQYQPLVDRWNKLSPEAQEIYKQFRDAYRKRSEQFEQARIQRIEDMKGDGVSEGQRRMLIQRIKQDFESERLQGVYFPLHRTGDFFLAAEKGDTYTYLMFESLNEQERKVAELRKRGWTVMAQGMKSKARAKDAPSGSFVADVIQQLREANISEKVQDEIYQLYLETMPELSMRKRSIHRRSIPGFEQDAVKAFAFNMHHGAHQLARERYAYKLQDVLGLLEKQQDVARREPDADTRRVAAGDAIIGELKRRHDWIMNPTDSALTNMVSSFGFVYYLGATPAAALVNLTQTALVSYPFLAARHGPVKAMNYLLAASKDAVRTVGNIQRTLTDPDELKAYEALQVSGAIDKTQAHNLAGIAEGGMAGYNPAWSKAMEIIGWGFHKTEVVNREATGMAAFRLARDGGSGFDEAVKFAQDAIFDTHFDYSNANRARFMQSGTAKVLLMFRQYSLNMTWALGRMVWQATKGQSPEVRQIARRNLAGVMGMSALFSGALGLPMMGVAMGTLNALQAAFGDDDEPWDAETEFRAFLAEALGPGAAELLLRGAANKLTGANIAGRVGLDSLWIRDADRELEGRGLFNHLLEQAAGPMGGVLKNVLVGTQQIGEGHTMRGVETMLPKGLKDVIKAGRFATQGVNTLRGDPILEDVSPWQVLLQGAGFSPAEVAERYELNRALKNYEEHITSRRKSLMNAYAMAIRNGDASDREAVMEKIRQFNKTNPEVAISSAGIRASLKSRASYSAKAEAGIVINPKLAARLQERVGPAE